MSTDHTKRFEYAASVDRAGRVSAEGGAPVELGDGWSAEHLVLAGLVRCTLASMDHSARRVGLDSKGAGSAHGTVTKRDDGLYAFVDVATTLEVDLAPAPEPSALRELVTNA